MARGPYSDSATIRVLRALIDYVESDTPAVPLPKVRLRTGRHPLDWMLTGDGVPTDLSALYAMEAADLEALRLDLRAFLRFLAGEGKTSWRAFPVKLTPLHVSTGGVKWIVEGSTADQLCYQTMTFLDRIGGLERVRLCPAPDCARVYLKIGRREFCSTRCQQRIYQRDYDPFAAKPRRADSPRSARGSR